jgi:hypothetical protein
MRPCRVLGILVLALVSACAAKEVLEAKSATVPPGIDFSGYWRMQSDSPAERDRINKAIGIAAGDTGEVISLPPDDRNRPSPRERIGGKKGRGGLVQVFLQSGRNLKVTQTSHGIFISFDRSVVEEFRFGENRTVSVGAIDAQRVSGWVGARYVVETLDKNGMKLTEQLSLSDDRQTLQRLIVLRNRDGSEITLNQSFQRDRSQS